MAVEAVVSVVIQKLKDMLKEESISHEKNIVEQLEEISKSLEGMGTEVNQRGKEWEQKYLGVVYQVEDEIEKFALRIARQRKRLGFLMNHALFFNNLNACHKLRRKMKRIRSIIVKLKREKPEDAGDKPQQQHNQRSISREEEQEEKEGEGETKALEQKLISQVHTDSTATPESPNYNRTRSAPVGGGEREQKPKLTFCYSCNEKELRIVSFKEERLQHSKQMSSFSYEEEELGIFGIKKAVEDLVKRLTETEDCVVPIVGKAGSGKTTLARAICRNSFIKKRFEGGRAWVSVLKEYSNFDILLSLLARVEKRKDDEGGPSIHDQAVVKAKLLKLLTENKYLVVLDGLQTDDAWEDIKSAFPETPQNGSKIIFTTCNAGTNPNGLRTHSMERLDEEHSWNMFLNEACKHKTHPPISETLKRDIVEKCEGLPLNILLLGGLLSTKEVSNWASVDLRGADVWLLCYNDLTAELKLCLLYLLLFLKQYDIPIRRLLRLWLAEGLVKKHDKFPEDRVQTHFNDLANRNLIQISKKRSDNSPRKCRLIGVLHDNLMLKAQAIRLFYVHSNSNNHCGAAVADPFGIHRLVEYEDIKSFSHDNDNDTSKLRLLRSYLSFNFQKKDTPAKEIGRFLDKIIGNGFGLLRVLDLEGVYKPSLPDKLGDLFHLRYLGLRWTFLDTLPQTVGDLPYLETLDVKHTNLNSLPNSIWKLKHLRHLNLNEFRLDMPEQRRCSLTVLTLWGLFVDDKSLRVKNGLNSLLHLRELGISFHLTSTQNDLFDWIAKLTSLQSLRLRSKDDMGRPSELKLKPLSELEKLSHLNFLGNLQRLPLQTDFPPNLKVLTLSVSRLNKDPMPTLGQLQSLTVLRLLANSYLGEKMDCRGGGFGKLRVLKLWMLKQLKEWEVEEGTMENLKELDIRCCDKLNEIPPILLQLKTFEELILTNMPKKLTANVRQRKLSHTSLTVNTGWEFAPLPWEQDGTSSYRDGECNGDDGPSVMQSVVSDVKTGSSGGSSSTIQLIEGKGKEKILSTSRLK